MQSQPRHAPSPDRRNATPLATTARRESSVPIHGPDTAWSLRSGPATPALLSEQALLERIGDVRAAVTTTWGKPSKASALAGLQALGSLSVGQLKLALADLAATPALGTLFDRLPSRVTADHQELLQRVLDATPNDFLVQRAKQLVAPKRWGKSPGEIEARRAIALLGGVPEDHQEAFLYDDDGLHYHRLRGALEKAKDSAKHGLRSARAARRLLRGLRKGRVHQADLQHFAGPDLHIRDDQAPKGKIRVSADLDFENGTIKLDAPGFRLDEVRTPNGVFQVGSIRVGGLSTAVKWSTSEDQGSFARLTLERLELEQPRLNRYGDPPLAAARIELRDVAMVTSRQPDRFVHPTDAADALRLVRTELLRVLKGVLAGGAGSQNQPDSLERFLRDNFASIMDTDVSIGSVVVDDGRQGDTRRVHELRATDVHVQANRTGAAAHHAAIGGQLASAISSGAAPGSAVRVLSRIVQAEKRLKRLERRHKQLAEAHHQDPLAAADYDELARWDEDLVCTGGTLSVGALDLVDVHHPLGEAKHMRLRQAHVTFEGEALSLRAPDRRDWLHRRMAQQTTRRDLAPSIDVLTTRKVEIAESVLDHAVSADGRLDIATGSARDVHLSKNGIEGWRASATHATAANATVDHTLGTASGTWQFDGFRGWMSVFGAGGADRNLSLDRLKVSELTVQTQTGIAAQAQHTHIERFHGSFGGRHGIFLSTDAVLAASLSAAHTAQHASAVLDGLTAGSVRLHTLGADARRPARRELVVDQLSVAEGRGLAALERDSQRATPEGVAAMVHSLARGLTGSARVELPITRPVETVLSLDVPVHRGGIALDDVGIGVTGRLAKLGVALAKAPAMRWQSNGSLALEIAGGAHEVLGAGRLDRHLVGRNAVPLSAFGRRGSSRSTSSPAQRSPVEWAQASFDAPQMQLASGWYQGGSVALHVATRDREANSGSVRATGDGQVLADVQQVALDTATLATTRMRKLTADAIRTEVTPVDPTTVQLSTTVLDAAMERLVLDLSTPRD